MTQTSKTIASHRTRRWLPYGGAVVLVALIVFGLWPKPVPVETAAVVRGPLRVTVNEEGKTRIKQRYVISAPVTGQLRRIEFKAGAEIKPGQTVAVIDPASPALLDARSRTSAEARRDAAAANLEKARAARSFNDSELKRFEKLSIEKTISPQELEAARFRDASAAKEEEAAAGALRQAEAELAEIFSSAGDTNSACLPREVKAPAGSHVLHVFEENARMVAAGTPLLETGEPTDLEVVIEVLSRDGAMIQPGAKAELVQWGGGTPLDARVRLVEPAAFTKISALGVEEQRVNVIADLLTPPEQRSGVGDNFRIDARIVTWEAADVLKVPVGALFRRGEQWATFVIQAGRAQLRTLQAGHSNGTETEVLDGLKAGDKVILYPGSRVRAGDRVKPITITN